MKIVENPKVTSKYGVKRDIILDNGSRVKDTHDGVDIVSQINNDNLYAIADGKVLFTTDEYPKKHDGTGSRTIVTAHGGIIDGCVLLVLYAHCASFKKKKGDAIKAGDVVAIMGATGQVQGKHLHCSMYAIPSNTWHNIETGKWYAWSYATRKQFQIDPNVILKLY